MVRLASSEQRRWNLNLDETRRIRSITRLLTALSSTTLFRSVFSCDETRFELVEERTRFG